MESLRSIVISGGRWMLFRQALGQPVRIFVSILLTRIIAPEDFGIVAKAMAITGIIELLFINGLFGSIVQSKEINNKQLNSLFFFSLLFSVVLSIGVFVCAKPIATFYNDIRVIWVVQITSLSIFISFLGVVFNAVLFKELSFKKLSLIHILATIISSLTALIMAYFGYGYRALVYQTFILNVLLTLGAIAFAGWIPQLNLNFSGLGKHLRFGTIVILNNLLTYGVRNSDNVAIGKFQSDLLLGYYSRAYFLMMLPISQVGQIFSATLFPVFSKIQSDRERILAILNQVQEIIIILVYPLLIWFFFNIDFLIEYILGDKWVNSTIFFKVFIPLMIFQIFTTQINNIYMALDKMGTLLKISAITKPLLIGAIILAATESTLYVAVIITIISSLFGMFIYWRGMKFLDKKALAKQFSYLRFVIILVLLLGILFFILEYFVYNKLYFVIISLLILLLFYFLVLKYKIELRNKIREIFKLDKSNLFKT